MTLTPGMAKRSAAMGATMTVQFYSVVLR